MTTELHRLSLHVEKPHCLKWYVVNTLVYQSLRILENEQDRL